MDKPVYDDAPAEALLHGLIAHDSPSTCERPAVEYLTQQMRHWGLKSYIDDAGNAIGEMGDGERTLVLLGHIDTVPGHVPVRREGDLLYGRGAVDAKGPLAAFVVAAGRARPLHQRVVVVGAVEEEAATSKGARFLLGRLCPHAVIIGEPSGWDRITVGYKGRLLLDYTLSRPMGHTAGPQSGVCEEAVAFWQRVADFAAAQNGADRPLFEQITPSLRRIHSTDDGLSETVCMTIGWRLPPAIPPASLEQPLADMAGAAMLRLYGHEAAFRADKNTPLVRACLQAIRAEGGSPKFQVKSGTSDMNIVGPVWGCPILAYGPGDSTLDHTPQEHIDLREYHRAIRVLTRALIEMDAAASPPHSQQRT